MSNQPFGAQYVPPVPPRTPSNGLATGGFVVALVGAVIALIPFLGLISWVISPVGLILSVIGLVVSGRRGAGRGLAIAGIVLGIVGLLILAIWTSAIVSAGKSASSTPVPTTVQTLPNDPSANSAPASPAPASSTSASINGPFSAGTYSVGTEMAPGNYSTPGGNFCYYSRLKDVDGQIGSIISNQVVNGQGKLSVKSSDKFIQLSGDCTWTKTG